MSELRDKTGLSSYMMSQAIRTCACVFACVCMHVCVCVHVLDANSFD